MKELIIFIVLTLGMFFMLQVISAGIIGNRRFSFFSRSHGLIEKKGLSKLIYFKPKHFDCYSIVEVVSFFLSFILWIFFGIILLLLYIGLINIKITILISLITFGIFFLGEFVWVLVNDITCAIEERNLKKNNISWASFNVCIIIYYDKNKKKVKSARKKCVNFFKYYKKVNIEKVEGEKYYGILFLQLDDKIERIRLENAIDIVAKTEHLKIIKNYMKNNKMPLNDIMEKNILKSQYKEKFQLIKKEIDRWNPYDLLNDDLADEFEMEIAMLVPKISVDDEVINIAKTVSEVFSSQFCKEDFTVEKCKNVAQKIKDSLVILKDKC